MTKSGKSMFRIEFDEEEKKVKAFTLPILTRHFYDMSNMMSRNEGLFILSHHTLTKSSSR